MSIHPIRKIIHGDVDIYEGVQRAAQIRKFTSTERLYEYISDTTDISLACEVGSWVGYSAFQFCQHFTGHLVCVDTWLGSPEHWLDRENPRHDLKMRLGHPQIYGEFMSTASLYPDRITPLPQTSAVAAQLLHHWGARFDMIYLDGDHSYAGVRADIQSYAHLLEEGGILCGDDFTDSRFEVARAVTDVLGEDIEVLDDNFWIWKK